MEIGNILYEMRMRTSLSGRGVSMGICPVSGYNEYEAGRLIPDFLTLNAILERLGQGFSSLSVWLSHDEILYLQWRDEVCESIGKNDLEALAKLLEEKYRPCPSFNKKLQEQFFLYAKGVLSEKQHNIPKNNQKDNYLEEAVEYYRLAYLKTLPFLDEKGWHKKRKVGSFEAGIYCLFARLKLQLGGKKASQYRETLEQIYDCVASASDVEQKVKIIPLLACVLEETEDKDESKGEYERWVIREKRLEEGYRLLRECRYLYHVNALLEYLIKCKKALQKDVAGLVNDKIALETLYYLFDRKLSYSPQNLHGNVWMVVSMGEYLEKGRKQRGLTQEEISEGICEPENYSRIERGHRKPRVDNYKALTEKVRLNPKYYGEILESEKTKAHLLRMELSKELFEGNYQKAKKILEELEKTLGDDKEKNRQFMEERMALLNYKLGLVGKEERIGKLKEIISYTMDLEDVGKNLHTYTKTEMNLVNQLGCMYLGTKKYDKAICLFENYLSDMTGQGWSVNQRFRETYIEALNLEKCYADLLQFDKANKICLKYINRALDIGFASNLDEYLAEYSYNLENGCKKGSDMPRKLCKLAVAISEMYGTQRRKELINEYYNRIYGH